MFPTDLTAACLGLTQEREKGLATHELHSAGRGYSTKMRGRRRQVRGPSLEPCAISHSSLTATAAEPQSGASTPRPMTCASMIHRSAGDVHRFRRAAITGKTSGSAVSRGRRWSGPLPVAAHIRGMTITDAGRAAEALDGPRRPVCLLSVSSACLGFQGTAGSAGRRSTGEQRVSPRRRGTVRCRRFSAAGDRGAGVLLVDPGGCRGGVERRPGRTGGHSGPDAAAAVHEGDAGTPGGFRPDVVATGASTSGGRRYSRGQRYPVRRGTLGCRNGNDPCHRPPSGRPGP